MLQELETRFALQSETLATEFKSWLDLSNAQGRAPLAKAAIALTNHGGGTIVVGMREAANKPIGSHPRPQEIPRYTTDAVNAAVNKYAEPHIHCDVVHLYHPVTGHEHAFVIVPGGQTVPVMSVKDADGTILSQRVYIRKPGPKSEEPFNSEEWRGLLNRCVQNGRENMLESIRAIFYGLQAPGTPAPIDRLKEFSREAREKWEALVAPIPKDDVAWMTSGYELGFEIVGVKPVISLKELYDLLEEAHGIKHTGWSPFIILNRQPIAPAAVDGALQTWVGQPSDLGRTGRHVDFWRVSKDGLLFQLRALDEDFHPDYGKGAIFSLTTPIWRVGDAALFVARLAEAWGGERVIMRGRYFGLKGRVLTTIEGWSSSMSYPRVSLTDSVTIGFDATVKEITENTEEVMRVALAPLYEAFDLFTPSMQMIISQVSQLKRGRF